MVTVDDIVQHGSPLKRETSNNHSLRVFRPEYSVLLTSRFNRGSNSGANSVPGSDFGALQGTARYCHPTLVVREVPSP